MKALKWLTVILILVIILVVIVKAVIFSPGNMDSVIEEARTTGDTTLCKQIPSYKLTIVESNSFLGRSFSIKDGQKHCKKHVERVYTQVHVGLDNEAHIQENIKLAAEAYYQNKPENCLLLNGGSHYQGTCLREYQQKTKDVEKACELIREINVREGREPDHAEPMYCM
jgi:hypothetical protein